MSVSELQSKRSHPDCLRIALLIGNEVTRQGLKAILRSLSIAQEVKICTDARRFFISPENRDLDIVIISSEDVALESTRVLALEAGGHGVKILLLLDRREEWRVDIFTAIPSNGFLVESEITADTLHQALAQAITGDLPMPPSLANRLLATLREQSIDTRSKCINLTPREHEALKLIVEGLSNKQIARQLSISLHGSKRLVANVLAKLNCPNRTVAATVALKDGIL